MNCEETLAQLSAYLDGRLDEAHRRAVERHLASCSHCRAEVAALRRTIESVSALSPVEPPPGFSHRIMAQVREEAQPSVPRRSFVFPPWPRWARIPLQAAAVLVIAGLAVYLYELNRPAPLLQAPAITPSTHDEGVRLDRDRLASPEATIPAQSRNLPSQEVERPSSIGNGAPADALKPSNEMSGLNAPGSSMLAKKEARSAADHEVALTVRLPFNEEERFMHELTTIVRQMNGTILPPEEKAAAGKLEPQKAPASYTVWLTIPPDRYPELRGKLASLGTIEDVTPDAISREGGTLESAAPSPPPVSSATPSQFRIKLTIHPPQP